MADDPRWGPATTYRSSPRLRRAAPPPDRSSDRRRPGPDAAPSERPRSRAARDPSGRDPSAARQPSRGGSARSGGSARGPGAAPGRQPYPPPRPARRRRPRWRGLVALVAALAIAYPVALGVVGYTSLNRVGPLPPSSAANTPGHTVLLVGSDSREGLSADQQVELSTGPAEEFSGGRTDTIMLLHTPPLGGRSVLLSLPRDSYVDIPGQGAQKINAAFAIGGPDLLTQTVEGATGIHVDGYAETGLAGFAGMVDAVGGVTMCPENAIDDPKAGLNIPAGCQEMNGATALGYARSRDSAVGGDLGRAQRQRELIAAIAGEATSPTTLLNPFTGFRVAHAGGGALSVDDGTGPVALARFANAFRSVASGSAISLTVPIASASRSTNAGLVVDWDEEAAQRVFEAIRTNDIDTIEQVAASQPNLE